MWAAVIELTGRRREVNKIDSITTTSLNRHLAAISTDNDYAAPARKLSSSQPSTQQISEWRVLRMLDTMRPTATGLDQLPSWFIKLGAPYLYKPLASLFSMSLDTSTVPSQWKPHISALYPKSLHRRLILIFARSLLLRYFLERFIFKDFLYLALQFPTPNSVLVINSPSALLGLLLLKLMALQPHHSTNT